jgi:hypothetical protein
MDKEFEEYQNWVEQQCVGAPLCLLRYMSIVRTVMVYFIDMEGLALEEFNRRCARSDYSIGGRRSNNPTQSAISKESSSCKLFH